MAYTKTSTDFLIKSLKNCKEALIKNTDKECKYPCGICKNDVKHNDKSILCSTCNKWIHIVCNGITLEDYKARQKRNRDNPDLIMSETWECLKCVMDDRASKFAFGYLDNTELNNLITLDSLSVIDIIPEFSIQSHELNNENISNPNDIDENIIYNIDSKYYSCQEFFNINNKKNNLKIFHSNMNGFSTHVDNLRTFLDQSNTEFDAICISETSLRDESTLPNDGLLVNYFEPYHSNTQSSKGGVAIFLKKNIEAKERTDLKACDIEYETVWIEIKNKKSKNTVIGCTYRRPHYQNIEKFTDHIRKCVLKLNKEKKDVYLTGDFNIDLLQYDSNKNYQNFYNMMTSNGFLPLILQPTRIRNESLTIIDNIYTNVFNESMSGNILIELADHLSQFAIIQKEVPIQIQGPKYKRDFKKFSEKDFLDDLTIQNWSNANDVHIQYEDFLAKFDACVERHAPQKLLNKNDKKKQTKPWITQAILKKIKHRNNLFLRTRTEPDNQHIHETYKRFRNSINRDIKNSKKSFYNKYFDDCKHNMKKTWKGINELINNNSKSSNINELSINKETVTNNMNISNSMNDFFVNVGPNTESIIPKTPVSPMRFLGSRIESNFLTSPTDITEVMILLL